MSIRPEECKDNGLFLASGVSMWDRDDLRDVPYEASDRIATDTLMPVFASFYERPDKKVQIPHVEMASENDPCNVMPELRRLGKAVTVIWGHDILIANTAVSSRSNRSTERALDALKTLKQKQGLFAYLVRLAEETDDSTARRTDQVVELFEDTMEVPTLGVMVSVSYPSTPEQETQENPAA